ncbi:MAG: GNAT family N-acetyltransferase [Mycobacterium leprae]
MRKDPFDECPVYETEHLRFTKVRLDDAEDLLACYSDPVTKGQMNNDNCSGDWQISTLDIMKQGIRAWELEFERRFFIRWSVYHKPTGRVIGTIEIAPVPNTTRFLDGTCETGILRIDIISHLAVEPLIAEILQMTTDRFYADFGIKNIIIKATQADKERTLALDHSGFQRLPDGFIRYPDYYIRKA